MSGAGSQNPAIYRALKDVLDRQPEIESVRYEPDAIQKRFLVGVIEPTRVEPHTGPEPPTLEVRWITRPPHEHFRVDYEDPNLAFHCGWHGDEFHPEFGDVHFQYESPETDGTVRRPAVFDVETPPRILWECCERLFEDEIPDKTGSL